MARRVVLHIGAMKSGTSYLQSLLFADKQRLAAAGVLVPGEVWTDQATAVRQALNPPDRGPRQRWDDLTREVRAADGTAVISMEYLGPMRRAAIPGVVEDLGADEVTVVVTARDLNRGLVSMWQETIQNGRTWGWHDYVRDAESRRRMSGAEAFDRSTPGGSFWRQQDLVRMVGNWARAVGMDNVVLVTVPQPGAPTRLLADRFSEASGIDLDPDAPVSMANESLGLASLLALREVNELLVERGVRWPTGQQLRKRVLAKTVMAARRDTEPRLGLVTPDWVREQSRRIVAELRASGVCCVGEWSDLDPVDVRGVDPDDVPADEVHRAAVAALAGLVAEIVGKRSDP